MSSGWVSVGATDWVLLVGSRFWRERGQERGYEAFLLWSLLLAKERGESWNRLLRLRVTDGEEGGTTESADDRGSDGTPICLGSG